VGLREIWITIAIAAFTGFLRFLLRPVTLYSKFSWKCGTLIVVGISRGLLSVNLLTLQYRHALSDSF
jgi:hypothetical protein